MTDYAAKLDDLARLLLNRGGANQPGMPNALRSQYAGLLSARANRAPVGLLAENAYADLPPHQARPVDDGMNWLQSASMATLPIPGVSDALGMAGDAQMFYQRPETRTPLNYLLAAAPGIPAVGGLLAMMNRPVDTSQLGLLTRAMHGQRGKLGTDITPMQRAESQGYDMEPWLHGGGGPLGKAIDAERLGLSTGSPAAKRAFFMTRSQSDAEEFAKNAIAQGRQAVPTVSRLLVRPQKAAVFDWAAEYPTTPIRSGNGQRLLAQMLDAAREQGRHMVLIRNGDDSVSGSGNGDVLAVLPEGFGHVRSEGAKFDAKAIGKAGLTLGLSGGGVAALLRDYSVAGRDDES